MPAQASTAPSCTCMNTAQTFEAEYADFCESALALLESEEYEALQQHWQQYCRYQQHFTQIRNELLLHGHGRDIPDFEARTQALTETLEPVLEHWPQTISGSSQKPDYWLYRTGDGIIERQVWIDSGKALQEPITIGQLTDLHFNLCDEVDLAQNDPVLMSTYQNRKWLANGASVKNAKQCLEHTASFDQTVITGDVLDYISHGNLALLNEVVWTPYPDTLVALGNHEPCIRMQGQVPEQLTIQERYAILQEAWLPYHDPIYTSRLIADTVLVIVMDNSQLRYDEQIVPRLEKDLQLARANGYTVLLFQHVPLWSNNPIEKQLPVIHYNGYPFIDLYTDGMAYGAEEGSATQQVYDLITSNADVIKGIFCGHEHGTFTSRIICPDGSVIPQYIQTGTCYNNGHVLRIIVE